MSYNGPSPTSSGKEKVGKLCLTTGHHQPVVASIRWGNSLSYNGSSPTSSGKDKIGKLFLTTGHHPPVVAKVRSEKYILQRATTDQ
jgi:hypothetical protein